MFILSVFENASSEWLNVTMGYGISLFPPWTAEWLQSSESMHSIDLLLPVDYQPWLYSIVSAILVGAAGIFPLLFVPDDHHQKENEGERINVLQLLLSFAVGGLLADVFLHLLPEAWTSAVNRGANPHEAFTHVGLCVLGGIFVFIVVEMLASHDDPRDVKQNEFYENNNTKLGTKHKETEHLGKIKVTGYLNLVANGIDNFAHGLAVAGSFLVSYKTGILTTTAILIHEIPHEIGDFAILLQSGFTRWEAARAQIYTACIGLVGALVTLVLGTADFLGGIQVYILGFTAGGFLNIALVTVLPDLLQENRPAHSAAQLLSLLFGIVTMAAVALFC